MMLLDTNVLSALMAAHPVGPVVAWFDRHDLDELWLPTLVIAESRYGIDAMSDGRRRETLSGAFDTLVRRIFANRILGFDLDAALSAAEIGARRKRQGRPAGDIDTLIAGLAVSRNADVVTRNVKHFSDLPVSVINPWAD